MPRKTLTHLYKSMIRPILEYASIVYDGLDETKSDLLESIQRKAGLVCTGAYQHTGSTNLLDELGWESLSTRRKSYRLLLFHKMVHDPNCPTYLKKLVPDTIQDVQPYYLRNNDDYRKVFAHLESHNKHFLLQTVTDWNLLDSNLRNIESFLLFKRALHKHLYTRTVNNLYTHGSKHSNISIARLRMGLSPLCGHLFMIQVINNPMCVLCNSNVVESCVHYLLQCPKFNRPRRDLLRKVLPLLPDDYVYNLTEEALCKKLLCGINEVNSQTRARIYDLVLSFIENTKRFSNLLNLVNV